MEKSKWANRGTMFLLVAVSIISLAIMRYAELQKEQKRNSKKIKQETPIKLAVDTIRIALN